MNELGILLVALTLVEGIKWVPLSCLAFVRRPLGGTALARPFASLSGSNRGICLPAPWVPSFECFLAWEWPFRLSPDGIRFTRAPGAGPGRGSFLSWEEVRAIESRGSKLAVAGRTVADAGAPGHSASAASQLRRIAEGGTDDRAVLVRNAIARRFSQGEVRKRLRRLRVLRRQAALVVWMLPVNLLFLGPVLQHMFGTARAWLPWAGVHFMLTAWAVGLTRTAAIRLGGSAHGGTLESSAVLILYPPAALRFLETLSLHFLSDKDPLCLAAEHLDSGRFTLLARERLAALHAGGSEDEGDRWFREAVEEEVIGLARRKGLTREDLFAPPEREADSSAYCPGCRTQYVGSVTRCADCGDRELVGF